MEPDQNLDEVEKKYRLVLELAQKQLKCIETNNFDELPSILQQKVAAVNEAGEIMAEIKTTSDGGKSDAQNPQLGKLSALIGEVMRVEDLCQKLMSPKPAAPPAPSRARVASLYAKSK
jgi:hypothetical protein